MEWISGKVAQATLSSSFCINLEHLCRPDYYTHATGIRLTTAINPNMICATALSALVSVFLSVEGSEYRERIISSRDSVFLSADSFCISL